MVRPTINSEKHYVQQSITPIASGAINVTTCIITAKAQSVGGANEVRIGSSVKAIYIERWIRGSDAGVGSSYILAVEKSPAGSADLAAGSIAALDGYANKKNVFFTSQGLINDDTNDATPVLRQWIKIPKGKQRFGQGDTLKIALFAQGGSLDFCGLQIFKEYW